MAFIFYFIVILVSVASVMFGIDLVTSPLAPTPNVPIGRVAHAPPPAPIAQARQAHGKSKSVADDRALSPIYPASPGARKDKAAQAPASAAAPMHASNNEWLPPPPPQQQATAAPQPDDRQAATRMADTAQPAPQPAAAPSAPRCKVAACSAAYRSFRASDCTYQPLEGPRRLCTRSGGSTTAAAPPRRRRAGRTLPSSAAAQAARDQHEVDEVTRIVRQMTRGEQGDIAVQDSRGRIIIVHPGGARAYSPYGND